MIIDLNKDLSLFPVSNRGSPRGVSFKMLPGSVMNNNDSIMPTALACLVPSSIFKIQNKSKNILELGVRFGDTTEPMIAATSLTGGKITCVDIDNANEYKNYLIKKHSAPNIEYVYNDIMVFEPKENFYDVVWMRSAIEHFSEENQIKLFSKIKKSLKTGGWYCGDTPANPEKYLNIYVVNQQCNRVT